MHFCPPHTLTCKSLDYFIHFKSLSRIFGAFCTIVIKLLNLFIMTKRKTLYLLFLFKALRNSLLKNYLYSIDYIRSDIMRNELFQATYACTVHTRYFCVFHMY